jgi:hypothetical protein
MGELQISIDTRNAASPDASKASKASNKLTDHTHTHTLDAYSVRRQANVLVLLISLLHLNS